MFAHVYRPIRTLLRSCDVFGVKPVLYIKDRTKGLSLTLVASLLCYVVAALLISQQFGNFIAQAESSSFTVVPTRNQQLSWQTGQDLNLSISVPVKRIGLAQGTNIESLQVSLKNQRRTLHLVRQQGNQDVWRFDLPFNQNLTLRGWNQTSSQFQQASLSIDCKQKGDIPCSFGVPYTLTLGVWSFDQGHVVPTRRQAIFQKMTFNRSENLHLELNAVLSSSDISSSPFKNLTQSIGLRLDQTNAHYQSEGEQIVIRLGRLMHLFTMAPYKSHRCLSNIGNYVTTLNILFLLLFIEFNQLNKYVRACTDLYVIKYLDQNDSLVIEKICPSVWDFLLPVRKALRDCPMVGKLKLKAVERLRQETDVEYIIKSVINLEKALDEHTTNHVNRYLIDTFFANEIAPPVVPRSLTSPPIILKVGPPVVPRVGPPRIPRTQPPIIPKTSVRSIQWSTASTEESQESGSRMVPPIQVQDPKIKSLVSLPSTVDTDYSQPCVSQVSAASSRDMFQSKKVQDYLRLTDVRAGRSLKQPTVPDSNSRVKQQILMSGCPKETLSQLTGSTVSASLPDIEIRAVQPKKESRKLLWRYLMDLSHNLLSRLDFFSYSINFEVKTNESICRSQVSGLCTIMAVWLTLAIMLLDVVAFLNTDSYSSHFQYTMPPEELAKAKLQVNDMKIFIFAHSIASDLIVDYNNVKNYTSAEAVLGDSNSSGESRLWPQPIVADKLPEATLAELTKLPFVKHQSDLDKGYWFNLSKLNFTHTGGLNLGFDFEYSHEVSSSIYNGTVLQLVVSTQQLNSTSQSFVERFQSYPLEYSFESNFTLVKKSISLTTLKLAYDTTVFPIKHNHHQYGYMLANEAAQTRQHNDQTKGRKISVQCRMTDRVVEYRQSLVKVDEFIGNVQGVLIFIICWVALIGVYLNRKKLHYTIASVFYPDKVGFSWAQLFRSMLTHRRVKELESMMGKARKGQQLLRLDNLQQRIRSLERYSQLPYNSQMDRSLSRVYVKEAQKPSGKTVPFRSTTSLVPTLAEIGSSLIRLSNQYPCKKMEATVRQQQSSSSKCNKVWRRIGCLDMLDQPVKLSFRGRPSYSSGVTQLISVMLLVGMLGMFSFYLRDYFGMGGTSIQQSTQPASVFQIDDRYSQGVQLKLGFRDKANLNLDSGFMDRLLSLAQMNLFVSGRPAQFTSSSDAADEHVNIRFDNALLRGQLDSSIIRFELLEKQFPVGDYTVNADLHGLLKKELLKTELRVCLTNFHFSPNAKHSQPISQALDCTQYFHMPFTLNAQRSTPVDMVQLQDQHYHVGLFHSTSQQALYTYRPIEDLSYSRKDQDHWNFTYEYRFSGMEVQYQLTPSNLNVLANKLIGALALFVCLLLFLTSVNKTRFMLQLGCTLYQNQVGAVTFMDAFLALLLKTLPVSCRCKLSDRTKQLLFLYEKASQHLSIKLLMHKIHRLETGIYRGMSQQQRQQLTLPVRQEVTHQPTLNPEQHRTHNQLKRHLKSSKVYTRLSVDVGLSDSDILAILPALAQPHRLSTTSAQRKLHQLQLQLQ